MKVQITLAMPSYRAAHRHQLTQDSPVPWDSAPCFAQGLFFLVQPSANGHTHVSIDKNPLPAGTCFARPHPLTPPTVVYRYAFAFLL